MLPNGKTGVSILLIGTNRNLAIIIIYYWDIQVADKNKICEKASAFH